MSESGKKRDGHSRVETKALSSVSILSLAATDTIVEDRALRTKTIAVGCRVIEASVPRSIVRTGDKSSYKSILMLRQSILGVEVKGPPRLKDNFYVFGSL